MSYLAILGDLVESRRAEDRAGLQRRLKRGHIKTQRARIVEALLAGPLRPAPHGAVIAAGKPRILR